MKSIAAKNGCRNDRFGEPAALPAQPLTCMEKLAPSLPICPPALAPGNRV